MPPGPPIDLRACRVTEDFIEIEWTAPKSDGGTALTNYHIEISPLNSSNWQKVAKVSAYDTYFRATRLEEDMDYYFSVCAENSVGKSEPCQTLHPITTKRGLRKYMNLLILFNFSFLWFLIIFLQDIIYS